MTDAQSSFWTPRTVAVVIGAVLLIVALAYLVSLPQNKFVHGDLLAPVPGARHAGGGEAHENRPPYYALAYIMKLA